MKNKKENNGVFEKVYQIVAKIPQGRVMTYGQVGKLVNTIPRVVGFAMRANKDTKRVPCHRVVSSEGKLSGYAFGGIERKRELLKHERITFLQNGAVDLRKSLYTPINYSNMES